MKRGINKDLCSILQLENCFGASLAGNATQNPQACLCDATGVCARVFVPEEEQISRPSPHCVPQLLSRMRRGS